jgi:ubiquinone/menaquinone biosynthesis C-methylase UbiE
MTTHADDTPEQSANHYDRFYGPLYFEPFAVEVEKRIKPVATDVALEIAAGTGRVTRHIRDRLLPLAQLIASDIESGMLDVAKRKLNHLPINWQIIDAQQLPFGDNSIDLVVCCFGYMFVADKPKAFAEVYRVLKPGGHFIFTTWDKLENNPASYSARSVATEYLKQPLPPSYDMATSLSDETVLLSLLRDAGFSKLLIEKVQLLSSFPNAKEAAEGFIKGDGVFDEVRKSNPNRMHEIRIKLEMEFVKQFGDAPMKVPISALISEAWK